MSDDKIRKLRFKNDDGKEFGEWEETAIGNISEIYDGTHQTPNYKTSGIRFVSVENISDIEKSKKYISIADYERNFSHHVENGDIFMTRIGDIGTPALVNTNETIAYYVSLALIKCNKNRISPNYLVQAIKYKDFQKELYNRTLHIAFPKKINMNEIGKCKISVPTLPEQKKISDFLSKFDEKIKIEKEILDKWKLVKKGLLQQMFV